MQLLYDNILTNTFSWHQLSLKHLDDAPTFISDIKGYHKVGNPDPSLPAVTLHLYCPPFQRCKIWMKDCNDNLKASSACMCYYSEYGVRLGDEKKCDELFEVVNI